MARDGETLGRTDVMAVDRSGYRGSSPAEGSRWSFSGRLCMLFGKIKDRVSHATDIAPSR